MTEERSTITSLLGTDRSTIIIPSEVSKKLVQEFRPENMNAKRISTETAAAVSEALRQFVIEAHSRASIEVMSFVLGLTLLVVSYSSLRVYQ
jgi:hypothetical protein